MKHVEWKPVNVIPEKGMPILVSFEDYEYPEIGYYDDFDGKFYVESNYHEDDIAAEKIGKVNGWIPLPTCKDYKEGR